MIKRYDKFIESRKHRILPEGVYTENHHILPESWGGTRDEENMIRLTAREHYIAHKMLFRENRNDKSMAFAFYMMCKKQSNQYEKRDYKVTSRDYEKSRNTYLYYNRGENNPMYGKNPLDYMTEEVRNNRARKISASLTGVPHSEERRLKNSLSQKGKTISNECRQHMSEGHKIRILVTNLITGEVKEFSCAKCDECAEYLDFKTKESCSVNICNAINHNGGVLNKRKGRLKGISFKVEYLQS